jgi:mycothiol synthase
MSDSPRSDPETPRSVPEEDAKHPSQRAPEEDAKHPSRRAPDWLIRLIADARAADCAPPFSDQSLVDYRAGVRELVAIGEDAAALVAVPEPATVPEVATVPELVEGRKPATVPEPVEGREPATVPELVEGRDAEFVVHPDARGRGLGTQLLDLLLAGGATLFWAHGDAPAARALAASHGLTPVRELLHFSADLPTSASNFGAGLAEVGKSGVEAFVVGRDEDEWVALNAKTFAAHPEQGSVTRADLEQLETERWFRADDFLVLRQDGRMIGYCWLKVEGDRGEFYVVGVDPGHHGEKLGSLLFDAGLARLRELGIRSSHLYVEADNAAALRLYRSRGFAQDAVDIQYAAGL